MRNAIWLVGFALSCACVSVAVAVDTIPMREPAPPGKTRDEVKRELAAARVSGCMDVPDSQYPRPCPSQDTTRLTADAFQIE
ncbi:hypothetical protein R69927_02109 [Paraburkholderia domus]|jgi:hypothetical protein|uniref:DUF4148 domain-containing protein n=1 Tax=Paraburkholderia domus TaxID=2793075 RepID=A0A9N8MV63_9BURK|nr:DUF4148 domain-containing protein [Paraburkholderia domus]MBK5049968.1 DUF4148 domain-containing protein [Burkholderia sp. R-70006]MBK5063004.1 DUF4148 domain-containing protein [Burkholderia sp. R-70199]MBK5086704.1 DUF4148 domain-containing protein [Burkholderia sp. R-69927]MBK5121426.1 DUF4148 domain-containing protein [Burkholderia sp. R-69980]MBK5166569.1 DUF4148 domain-containing protein [Burkholderia sp. R-70211]MBK5182444.1 DUF4148 domain-containing protein [Burkholderia sp. R-6974